MLNDPLIYPVPAFPLTFFPPTTHNTLLHHELKSFLKISFQSLIKGPAHRVTFNDKNEVASQDKDGTFTVTYSQLGEKIVPRQSPDVSEMKKPPTPGSDLEDILGKEPV